MASVTHLAAGALCGAVYARNASAKSVISVGAFALLALAPDLDFILLATGLGDGALEHRVMSHSLVFAGVVGLAIGALLAPSGKRWLVGSLATLSLASHGLLDAMTSNAPGPQLFWPFAATPVDLGWHPIPGTEFYQQYFSLAAIPVVSFETLLSLPLVALTVWVLRGRSGRPDEQVSMSCEPLLVRQRTHFNE